MEIDFIFIIDDLGTFYFHYHNSSLIMSCDSSDCCEIWENLDRDVFTQQLWHSGPRGVDDINPG